MSAGGRAGDGRLISVAVPMPLPGPLTYTVDPELHPPVEAGMRVRVPVGSRQVEGIVVATEVPEPEGVRLRAITEVLDLEPVMPAALLELADFVSRYYLAPPGEVMRAMLPRGLRPLGRRTVRLTERGAFARTDDAELRALLDHLLEHGPSRLGALRREANRASLAATVERGAERGWLQVEGEQRSGSRYRTAYELKSRDRRAMLEACGRSPKARAVVDFLAALQRPASRDEITAEAACTVAVLRRLEKVGVLRSFTEVASLDLDRHRLGSSSEKQPLIVLTQGQAAAVDAVRRRLGEGVYAAFLLQGITGSGKTEIYLRVAEEVLARGRSVILLVPEISLVPALAAEARRRFGALLAILHSGLSVAERTQEWERLRLGEARVVVGPRSALFAPLADVGLIVVDEEQESSYKQDAVPRYSGRDLALVRARQEGAVAILASATPSLESRHNVDIGRLQRLHLGERVAGGALPEVSLVDLRRVGAADRRPGEVTFSEPLLDALRETLESGAQAIVLRNRRGFAPTLLCRACGETNDCEDCGLPRTLHRRPAGLLCHYCGSRRPVPDRCPHCGQDALDAVGSGTERVEERLRELFPDATVDLLDRDTTQRIGGAAAVLERFGGGATDILVGTQMISKGHHFPQVALTCVLAADTYLGFPDFRAVEKTYNLLTQAAGRAGRGDRPGRVIVQTYYPQHYALQAVLRHDDQGFAAEEMRFRRTFHYPPFTRLVQLMHHGSQRDKVEAQVREMSRRLEAPVRRHGIRMSGPAPAALERLKGKWRFQILLRHHSGAVVRQVAEEAVVASGLGAAELTVDVDPQDLL